MRVEKWLLSFAKKGTTKGDSWKLLLDAHEPSWLCVLSLHRVRPFTLTAFLFATFLFVGELASTTCSVSCFLSMLFVTPDSQYKAGLQGTGIGEERGFLKINSKEITKVPRNSVGKHCKYVWK